MFVVLEDDSSWYPPFIEHDIARFQEPFGRPVDKFVGFSVSSVPKESAN